MNEMVGAPEQALGTRLQIARRTAGFTQQALCQRANLSYSTLAKIERGAIKSPSIFTIQNIAGALGVSLDTLLDSPPARSASKKTSKSGVQFVYFDVNGCLVRFFQKAFSALAQATGASPDLVESTFWHYNDELCRGAISPDEFNAALAERLGIDRLNWQDYYFDAIDPMPGMIELVTWASQHYQVGLLTNIMPGALDIMKTKGLIPAIAFDAIIDSSVVHTVKPEAAIYDIASSHAGVEDSAILFIDDSRPNLVMAEKRGWRVLWFDDYQPQESIRRIKLALELP